MIVFRAAAAGTPRLARCAIAVKAAIATVSMMAFGRSIDPWGPPAHRTAFISASSRSAARSQV